MYRNIESFFCAPGTNIVLWVNCTSKTNKQTNKLIEKEIIFVVTRGVGVGELDEDSQKVQISSNKINRYLGM